MKALNQKQTEAIGKIGLADDSISEVERDTQWRFCQHTNGTDIRFQIKRVRGEYEFVIWLKKKITIGVYVYSRKQEWQKRFREKIGDWAPEDTHPSHYTDQGTNPNKGHVGDWRSEIGAGQFLEKIESIKRMVRSITDKLEETGIWRELANGKPIVELGQGVVDEKEDNDYDEDEEGKDDDTRIESGMIKNLIVFGAPGTGKSHKLEKDREVFGDRYERVTFYPTYSYAQFVGTYKPVMKPVKDAQGNPTGKEEISYEFVPGPFLRVLVKALNEAPDAEGKKKDWCLVIEEINRANAAAVFGDVFQLLDRASNDDVAKNAKKGTSEYTISVSEDVKKYLGEALTDAGKNALLELTGLIGRLKIPANMYIWATMNSADQGVFPMDTAFKRRWEFEYINIDNGKDDCAAWMIGGKAYNWNQIREFINGLLSQHGINEDKLMGAHFVKAMNNVVPDKAFKSKVLMYLWEDAARMCRRQMFGDILTYSDLCDKWDALGIKVFEKDSELKKLDANSPLSQTYSMLAAEPAGK